MQRRRVPGRCAEDQRREHGGLRRLYDRRICPWQTPVEALRKASAISAAAAMREETGFFVKEDMETIYPQITIEKIG